MRVQTLRSMRWRATVLLFAVAILMMLAPRTALAQDALFPQAGSGDDAPLVEQATAPPPGPPAVQLVSSTTFFEDPTRQAGGEDDAQRANERQVDRQNDDDGQRRT
jgi:hypothetical protein